MSRALRPTDPGLSAPLGGCTFQGMDTHARGARYEAAAAAHLQAAGWTVLERNVRFGRKEVDLIVRRGGVVAFVEVKGRRGPGFGHPFEAITALKRREIETVARWWTLRQGPRALAETTLRFDAIAVLEDGTGRLRVEHLADAWRPTRA